MWRTAIKNHKILIKERNDASFWSDNIIDSTACLVEEDDWKKFYLYLCQSPQFFNHDNPQLVETLGEMENLPEVPAYGANQRVEIVENGPIDRIITVITVESETESDDEKLEH